MGQGKDENDDEYSLGLNTWEINAFEDFVPGFSSQPQDQDRIYRNAPPMRKVVQASSPFLARAQTKFKGVSGSS